MLWNMRKRHRKSIKESFGAVPSDCDRDQMRDRMDRIMIYHNGMEEQKDGFWIDPVTWDALEMEEELSLYW